MWNTVILLALVVVWTGKQEKGRCCHFMWNFQGERSWSGNRYDQCERVIKKKVIKVRNEDPEKKVAPRVEALVQTGKQEREGVALLLQLVPQFLFHSQGMWNSDTNADTNTGHRHKYWHKYKHKYSCRACKSKSFFPLKEGRWPLFYNWFLIGFHLFHFTGQKGKYCNMNTDGVQWTMFTMVSMAWDIEFQDILQIICRNLIVDQIPATNSNLDFNPSDDGRSHHTRYLFNIFGDSPTRSLSGERSTKVQKDRDILLLFFSVKPTCQLSLAASPLHRSVLPTYKCQEKACSVWEGDAYCLGMTQVDSIKSFTRRPALNLPKCHLVDEEAR